jgi:hypothetical protein
MWPSGIIVNSVVLSLAQSAAPGRRFAAPMGAAAPILGNTHLENLVCKKVAIAHFDV